MASSAFLGPTKYGVRKKDTGGWQNWKKQREIGYASGLTVGVESIAFNGLGVLAGWMGVLAIGAHAIVMNVLIFIAMISIGIGSATAIQVGFATGKEDIHAVRRSGWTGFWLTVFVVGLISFFLLSNPQWFASLYTSDSALMDVVVPAIFMLGIVVVFDGTQLVMSFALRGRGETWIISAMNFLAFIIILVPVSWWLSIKLNHGILGLYEAVLLSCVAATGLFAGYFWYLTRRDTKGRTRTGKQY
jgi:multidrug resistance protein, MATE family